MTDAEACLLANALLRSLRRGWKHDLTRVSPIEPAPIAATSTGRVPSVQSSYNGCNYRVMVFAPPLTRLSTRGMAMYLRQPAYDSIMVELGLEEQVHFRRAIKAPIPELFDSYSLEPNRYHRKGRYPLDATKAPEAFIAFVGYCYGRGLVEVFD